MRCRVNDVTCDSTVRYLPLRLSVTEDGLTAQPSLVIKSLLSNWYIRPRHDELYRYKENNFL